MFDSFSSLSRTLYMPNKSYRKMPTPSVLFAHHSQHTHTHTRTHHPHAHNSPLRVMALNTHHALKKCGLLHSLLTSFWFCLPTAYQLKVKLGSLEYVCVCECEQTQSQSPQNTKLMTLNCASGFCLLCSSIVGLSRVFQHTIYWHLSIPIVFLLLLAS